jgi:hypothetical protein
VEQCAQKHGYNEIEQREYRLHIEHVAAWMELYGVAEAAKHAQEDSE